MKGHRPLLCALALAAVGVLLSAGAFWLSKGPIIEVLPWSYGYVNESNSVFIIRLGEAGSGYLVLDHSRAEIAYGVSGESFPVKVFNVDCTIAGSVTLTGDRPYLQIDEAARIATGSRWREPYDTDAPIRYDPHPCDSGWWHVDVRNDWTHDILVKPMPHGYGGMPPQHVVAGSRSWLDYGHEGELTNGLTVQILDADCRPVGVLSLTSARNVAYLDAGGHLSAEGQASFWQRPPSFNFQLASIDRSACEGQWSTPSSR